MSATFLVDLPTDAVLGYSYVGTIASNTTTNGTGVDLQNTEGPVTAVVLTGDCGDATTTITVNLTESATSGGTYTAVGGSPSLAFAASATANDNTGTFFKTDKRSLRYVRAEIVTAAGSSISCPVAIGIFARKKISGTGAGQLVTG